MFKLITNNPVAIDSFDHTHPRGTINDNSRNYRFNQKIYQLVNKNPIRVIDLGCAGGGFISDCVQDNHVAIGLEGCDHNFKTKRAEWAVIPDNLFTCDCTKPFQILYNNEPFVADIITAWEFMEHIHENDLPVLFENICKHMAKDSYLIMSINVDIQEPYHQSVHPRNWWIDVFEKANFKIRNDLLAYFNRDYIRTDPPQHGFNLIVQANG